MKSDALREAASRFGTPLYVYDVELVRERIALLKRLFAEQFLVSYAIKSNPNLGLLKSIQSSVDMFDASAFAEVERAISAGMPPERISFSGPAKRLGELRGAVLAGVGELVIESLDEAIALSKITTELGRVQPCLVRINPLKVPRKFGASMAGAPSQFGVDEETLTDVLPEIAKLPGLEFLGFHVYSGTNCLDAPAIAENFEIFSAIFRQASEIMGIKAKRLIFGSGFGIPYLPDEAVLDHAALPSLVQPVLDTLRSHPNTENAEFVLEIGRWLVGPAGWLLTSVIGQKASRGKDIRTCDAGFNNHLAACGMMGSVFRRNWVYENLSNPTGTEAPYTLTGPLCTTIDRLAVDVEIAEPRPGDVIAIRNSGAYGLTASPTRFISHPEPAELLFDSEVFIDATESRLNHWEGSTPS